jgi:hypothetical protein
MLLDKNHALIGLVVILVIAAGTLFAVGATAGILVRGDRMEVELADAAGLKRATSCSSPATGPARSSRWTSTATSSVPGSP